MITGFNTDIEYDGVTYHVQTEDKGLAKPVILSLVYDRGTILASKRLPYDDLLKGEFDERVLSERLSRQHKLICAAIKAGRIEDLKKMGARENSPESETAANFQAVSVAAIQQKAIVGGTEPELQLALDEPSPIQKPDTDELAIPIPGDLQFDLMPFTDFSTKPSMASRSSTGGPLVDAVSIIEDVFVLPDNAVEILTDIDGFSDMAGVGRPVNDKLSVELLGDVSFKGGDRKTVSVMVCRGTERKVVEEAQIMVKVIGSSFRPVIFHAATDINGIAKINFQIPKFKSGRAAFLVRAMSGGEEIELRRPITHGY